MGLPPFIIQVDHDFIAAMPRHQSSVAVNRCTLPGDSVVRTDLGGIPLREEYCGRNPAVDGKH